MYFDKDVDRVARDMNPLFYGFIPDGMRSRLVSFLLLLTFSLAHVLSKTFAMALLWSTFGGPAVLYYSAVELVLFFFIKIVRSDFWSWVPTEGLVTSLFTGFTFRLAAKVLTDYTGSLQCRQPVRTRGDSLEPVFTVVSSIGCSFCISLPAIL